MQMTHEEIVRDYNSEIRAILAEAGVEGVKKPEKIMPRKRPEAPAPEPASAPAEDTCSRIETILDAVPEDASEYMRNNAVNLVTAMFSDYVQRRLREEARHEAGSDN